ncbi:hypothetical protein MRB53_040461 [Persea americana]|nr:hypothetical protein MRB53_040461 [Persea americana]
MPSIEEIPIAKSAAAPGWAYVPDNGYDPSKAPIVPSGARKRARNATYTGGAEGSARQQAKIARHIDELQKDDHRKEAPGAQAQGGGRLKDVTARGMFTSTIIASSGGQT